MEEKLKHLALKLLLLPNTRWLILGPLRRLWWMNRIKGALSIAVHYDLQSLCYSLIVRDKPDLTDKEGDGYRALLSAAELGRDQVIKLFLEGTNLEAVYRSEDRVLQTLVAWVAETGNRRAVRSLLRSADIISTDTLESSAYSVYETQKLPEQDDDLLDGMRKLHLRVDLPLIAVLSNEFELKRALSEPTVDIEQRDPTHEKTALHHASQSGRTGIVRLLLGAGASPTATDFTVKLLCTMPLTAVIMKS